MHSADKATLRLTLGLGLAALIAYGMALTVPYVVCVMAVVLLSKPGPPLPLVKGIVVALVIRRAGRRWRGNGAAAGELRHRRHPADGSHSLRDLLRGVGQRQSVDHGAGDRLRDDAVAGVIEQALVGTLALSLAVGVAVGTLVGFISSAFFPDRTAPTASDKPTRPGRAAAAWIALRATLIVMPVFVLALTDPSFYLAAIMKTVTLSQQAGETDARSAGRELVGSTLMGAFVAFGIWFGLSLWPNLWMLVLWMMAAALWVGSAMTGARRSRFRPTFWSNALITALILIGPAIEDSASGKSVLEGTVVRTCLFVGVAIYAWGTILLLERWRPARLPAVRPKPASEGRPA